MSLILLSPLSISKKLRNNSLQKNMEDCIGSNVVTLLFFLLLSHVSPSSAYGRGAPSAACDDVTPKHGVAPQTSPSPYKVVLGKTPLSVNTPLNITLTSKNDRDEFLGFLVQVRKVDEKKAATDTGKPLLQVGKFVNNAHSKDSRTLACSGKPDVAMTHTGNEPKRKVTVRWVPDAPGAYRVHTTFVKQGDTFWVNQVDDQIIEVYSATEHPDQHSSSFLPPEITTLCSTMKLNALIEPQDVEVGDNSPYQIMVKPVDPHQDSHKVPQKGQMWINVTSDLDTPILKLFMQVRPQHSKDGKEQAVGRFISATTNPEKQEGAQTKLVDCFGSKASAILFENRLHNKAKTSDVKVLWEAPEDVDGDFQAVVTILSEEDTFWDKVGDDPEAVKIKVVKKSSKDPSVSGSKGQTSSSSAGAKNFFGLSISVTTGKSTSSSFIFGGVIKLFLFFTLTRVLAL